MKSKVSGVGTIVVAQGISMWIGVAGEGTAVHSHHAVQVTLGLDNDVLFKGDSSDWKSYCGAVIAPHFKHAFCGAGVLIAHIFVEPESQWGQALRAIYDSSPLEPVQGEAVSYLKPMLVNAYKDGTEEALKSAVVQAVEHLTEGSYHIATIDPRILRSLGYIDSIIGQPVKLGDVAQAVHLSPGRFRHLFVQETGLTFRAYVLWLRLRRAVDLIALGQSLTSAAHAAGFADAAHLSRTFRRMFGVAPASLHKH